MGKLETTIILHDKFSDKLDKINKSIQNTANAMNRLNGNNATSVNNINSALSRQISQQTTIMKQMGQWATKLRNIATIYFGIKGAIDGINNAIKLSDQMTMADARLNLMTDKDNSLKDLKTKSFAAAMRSRTDYLGFNKAVTKLGILAGDKFANKDSIIRFTELMQKQFAVGGADASERQAAMLQLTQAIASNRLQGDELRSIRENAPLLVKAIQDSLNVSEAKFKDMAKAGEITADVIIKAMANSANEVEKMFNKLPLTWEAVWTRMKNVGYLAFEPIHKQLDRLFNNQRFLTFIVAIQNVFIALGRIAGWALKTVFDMLGKLFGLFERFPFLLTVLKGVLAGLTFAFAVFLATQLVGLTKSIIAWMIAKKEAFLYELALFRMAVAQYGLNAAIAMCPITWLLYAIIAVIVVIYLAVAAVNHFAGTSVSATGIVAGAFMLLVAYIYNSFVYLWNFISSWVEFFANVFKHPVYSVKKLFVNLASNVIDSCIAMTKGWDGFATSMANAMIDAVNFVIKAWNKLVDLLPDSVVAKLGLSKGETLSHTTSFTSSLESAKAGLQSLLGEAPSDYWSAPKMDYMGLKQSWNKGYEWGSNLESKIGDVFDELTKFDLDISKAQLDALNGINNGVGDMSDDLGNGLGDVGKNTGDTAKNTGDTAKNTANAYEEDYSYLRNWAYQAGMGNSIGYNIKIEQNNKNNIGSNMDLNRVVDAVRDAIIEGILTQAEGVRA